MNDEGRHAYCERHAFEYDLDVAARCPHCEVEETKRAVLEARVQTDRAIRRAATLGSSRALERGAHASTCRVHDYQWDPSTATGCPLCEVEAAEARPADRAARALDLPRSAAVPQPGAKHRIAPFAGLGVLVGAFVAVALWMWLNPRPPPQVPGGPLARFDATPFRGAIEPFEATLYDATSTPRAVESRLVPLADRLRLELPPEAQQHAMRLAALTWTVSAAVRSGASAVPADVRASWIRYWEDYARASLEPAPWLRAVPADAPPPVS